MTEMLRATAIIAVCASACVAACAPGQASEAHAATDRPEDELRAYAEGGTFTRYGQKVVITIAPSGNRTISGYLPGAKSPWVISKELSNGGFDEMEDRNGDGIWDSFRTLQQNAAGYHLLERLDNDGDNTPDEVIEEDVNVPQHERVRKVTRYFRGSDGTWRSTAEPVGTSPYPEAGAP